MLLTWFLRKTTGGMAFVHGAPLHRCCRVVLVFFLLIACGKAPRQDASGAAEGLSRLENQFQRLADLRDQIYVTRARGAQHDLDGTRLETLEERFAELLPELSRSFGEVDRAKLSAGDQTALDVLQRRLDGWSPGVGMGKPGSTAASPCEFDPDDLAGPPEVPWLSNRLYLCFGELAGKLEYDGEQLDRLTVLGRLSGETDPERRRRLFFSLRPLWEAIHPVDDQSPYRLLISLNSDRLRSRGSSVESASALLGVPPELVESWLVSILESWRDHFVADWIEPWDYYYSGGEASRLLEDAIPVASLRVINDRFYKDLGADPVRLGARYDLEPRPGKDPVAFTTFGLRNRWEGSHWARRQFWVFATYREGGFGNLLELLHETGHAVHIAAIDTRPAYQDWPDSDIFTESIADLAAWDAFDPDWQSRYLGKAAPADTGAREKFSSVVLDVAWALLEIRMHQDPVREPNQVWTDITSRYLGIRPHPELSWWVLRGQLVESPGYMLNYALGSVIVADLRKELKSRLAGRPRDAWYEVASGNLFHWGLEKTAASVIRDFLGRGPEPHALLGELGNR